MGKTSRKRYERSWLRIAGTAAWLVVVGLAAIAVVGAELDYATRERPDVAPFVPHLFRGHAYVPLATRAVQSGSARDGYRLTAELVVLRPVPAETLSLLAVAAGAVGRPELSARALTASARRGWRDPIAQSAVSQAALDAGDWAVAAERIDALQRSGSSALVSQANLGSLVQQRGGRTALAGRLGADPYWLASFLLKGSRELDADDFVDVVQRVKRQGGTFDCPVLAVAAGNLLARLSPEGAETVWAGKCAAGSARPNLLSLEFKPPADSVAGPFDWRYPEQPGLSRSFEEANGGWAIGYRNRDPLRRVVAARYLSLAPGSYVVRLHRGETRSQTQAALSFRLRCLGHGKTWTAAEETFDEREGVSFQVPERCGVQDFQVTGAQGRGKGIRISLEAAGSVPRGTL